MKKVFALVCSFLLLLSLASVCYAEGETSDMSWEELGAIAESVFGEDAHFVRLDEVDAKIWIPDYLERTSLSEEDISNNAIACFMPADETEMVYISYFDVNGLSLEAYQKQLATAGYSSNIIQINEIPALLYAMPENDSIIAVYSTADGYFLQLIFYPADNFFTLVLSSVQPDIEPEEETVPVVPVNPVSSLIHK